MLTLKTLITVIQVYAQKYHQYLNLIINIQSY